MNKMAVLDSTNLGAYSHFTSIPDQFKQIRVDFSSFFVQGGWCAQVYLLSLPQTEVLPQEQSELRPETHYGLSWQQLAKVSLWQLAHLLKPWRK